MVENEMYWRSRNLREHIAVIDGHTAPTLLLKNGTYLNVHTKQWLQANIWIYKDRIIYVGKDLPENCKSTEIVDCEGKYLVPGYIEPHSHPFQLYNPEELAHHAAKFGTTTLINDNLAWSLLLNKKKAFTLIENMKKLPTTMYWWARYDSQTALQNEEEYFNTEGILEWLSHHMVVQGGELSSWPRLIDGDDRLLYWIQETRRLRKPVEGHFPGASEKTLTKMKLFGVSGDHESLTGAEVIQRLELGYQVALRHSAIRPDLPKLLTEIIEKGITVFDQLMMTTDGSPPQFYEKGLINVCIEIAIENGVPLEDAYRMATFNAAKYYGLDDRIGSIAPGRLAHVNILDAKDNPHPVSVLAKGKWVVLETIEQEQVQIIDWAENGVVPLELDWLLGEEDFQFSTPVGLEMINDVIMKPCAVKIDSNVEDIPAGAEDAFLLLIDRGGKWRVNTMIRGFTNRLGAIVSSHSTTGDIIIIGKNKPDMLQAWIRMRELGGGIVLVHEGEVIFELALELGGVMSGEPMQVLVEKERDLNRILKDFGYRYENPIYNILFLSSTHLPYIRVTQQGIYDVMKRKIIFPAIMR